MCDFTLLRVKKMLYFTNFFYDHNFASEKGYVSVVTQLLAKGVLPNLKDNSSYTSLHLASQNGHTTTVQLLLTNNARVDQAINDGATPLWMACQNFGLLEKIPKYYVN